MTEKIFNLLGFFKVVSVVWPLSMITMGIIYRNDCPFYFIYWPVNLPFALIFFGAFALYAFPSFLKIFENHNDEYYENDESLSKSE